MTTLARRRGIAVVGALIALQVVLTLFVLARSPHRALPGFPLYRYNPVVGDGYAYYSAVRELLNTWQRDGRLLLPLAFVVVVALVLVWRRFRSARVRALASVWACGIVAAVLVERIRFTGAGQIGWSLVWSVLVLPYRTVGLPLDPDVAFAFGLFLSLLCNAVTIAMTYELGRLASSRWAVAVIAAALVAAWPLLMLLDPAHTSAQNGTWEVLLGLAMYTEPLSTALVLSGLVVLLRRGGGGADAVLGGALLGLASLVRVSNALIAAFVVLVLLMRQDRARALVTVGGGLAFLPAVVLFWPKGYPRLKPPVFPAHPFEFAYARTSWTHSLLWHPSVLVAIVPIAILGVAYVNRFVAAALGGAVISTAIFYTFYEGTPIHPRFLFVIVPPVFVFWAAGATAIASIAARLYDRPR